MKRSKRILLVLLLMVGCVGCDQSTKSLAEQFLTTTEAYSFLGDTFRLILTYNHGAFLSIGSTLPEFWHDLLLNTSVALILAGLLLFTLTSRLIQTTEIISLSLITAGGLSNLFDRLVYNGQVVDFMNIGIGSIRSGIFNFADIFIILGVGWYFLQSFATQKQNPKPL